MGGFLSCLSGVPRNRWSWQVFFSLLGHDFVNDRSNITPVPMMQNIGCVTILLFLTGVTIIITDFIIPSRTTCNSQPLL